METVCAPEYRQIIQFNRMPEDQHEDVWERVYVVTAQPRSAHAFFSPLIILHTFPVAYHGRLGRDHGNSVSPDLVPRIHWIE